MGKELESEPVLTEEEAFLARADDDLAKVSTTPPAAEAVTHPDPGGEFDEIDYQYIAPCMDPREDHYIPHYAGPPEPNGGVDEQMTADEERLLDELGIFGESRRKFLGQASAVGVGALLLDVLADQRVLAFHETERALKRAPAALENPVTVAFKVNGSAKSLEVDSRMTLLDALRERLALTGSKKGCDHGQCGACTVIVDGRRTLSCLTLAAQCEGRDVTTIEGLAKGGELHPVQAAFIKHDSFQCGYCTPGQICSAVALMQEAKNGEASYVTADVREKAHALTLSDEEIRERMSGNLCRCGAYPNIVAAIKEVHTGKPVDPLGGMQLPNKEVKHAAV